MGVGSKQQQINLQVSLTHYWTWVPTTMCSNELCTGPRFDGNYSTTFSRNTQYAPCFVSNARSFPEQTCGISSGDSVTIGGLYFSNYTFLSVTKSTYYYNNTYFQYGSILGLAYPSSAWDTRFSDTIFTKLIKSGDITNQIFSLYMNDEYMNITVGGYYESKIQELSNTTKKNSTLLINWLTLTVTFWSMSFNGVYLESRNQTIKQIMYTNDVAYFDLAVNYVTMPSQYLQSLITFIEQNRTCELNNTSGLYTCDCISKYDYAFPTVKIQTTNYFNLTLNSSQYLSYDKTTQKCKVLFENDSSEIPSWTLGQLFFKNIYTIYDLDKARIGYVQISLAYLGLSQETDEDKATATLTESSSFNIPWYYYLIMGGMALLIGLLLTCFICWCKALRKRKGVKVVSVRSKGTVKLQKINAYYDKIYLYDEIDINSKHKYFWEWGEQLSSVIDQTDQTGNIDTSTNLMYKTFNESKDNNYSELKKFQTMYNQQELDHLLLIKMRNPNTETVSQNRQNESQDHDTDDEGIIINQKPKKKNLSKFNQKSDFQHDDNDSEMGDIIQLHKPAQAFVVTPANITDVNPIEEAINQIMSNNQIMVPLIRINKHSYLFGTELINPFMNGNNCVVKVDGGFVDLQEYVLMNQGNHKDQIQNMMDSSKIAYEGVVSQLIQNHTNNYSETEDIISQMRWLIQRQAKHYKKYQIDNLDEDFDMKNRFYYQSEFL